MSERAPGGFTLPMLARLAPPFPVSVQVPATFAHHPLVLQRDLVAPFWAA